MICLLLHACAIAQTVIGKLTGSSSCRTLHHRKGNLLPGPKRFGVVLIVIKEIQLNFCLTRLVKKKAAHPGRSPCIRQPRRDSTKDIL